MNPFVKIALGIGGVIGLGLLLEELFTSNRSQPPSRRIFLSHSWKKARDEYDKIISKLQRENIDFYNHSIPEERAFDSNSRKILKDIFRKQMIYCSKVYVLARNGTKKESFVGMEIEIAKELGKEIIAVKPNGQYGMPKFIRDNADLVISNNIQSITKTFYE